jgi:flavin reductase (DIM6/NTAB) family NADH-FMN oxidoreductase RutF
LVLFCAYRRAPSLVGLIRSGHFAINVLASDQEDIARYERGRVLSGS